jgi:hypothetical protein
MSSTGTYAYSPAYSSLVLTAFSRIQMRRTEVNAEHMADADQECNLVQIEMSNRSPNLLDISI